ncbi:MAG: hypothetical protein AAF483_11705 [Planctomycetota bacterium]
MAMIEKVSGIRIAWVGYRQGPFQFLTAQLKSAGLELSFLSQEESISCANCDRIVYVSEDRLGLPKLIEMAESNIIPTAIALGDWHMGAGRTGLRESTIPLLPWYRFWDSWLNWLTHDLQEFYPAPPRNFHALTPEWQRCDAGRGLLLAGDHESLVTWQAIADATGCTVDCLRWTETEGIVPNQAWDWVLWDDGCVPTTQADEARKKVEIQWKRLHERLPNALKIAACILPQWSRWSVLQELGANELIAKPESGVSLGRVLYSIQHERKVDTQTKMPGQG